MNVGDVVQITVGDHLSRMFEYVDVQIVSEMDKWGYYETIWANKHPLFYPAGIYDGIQIHFMNVSAIKEKVRSINNCKPSHFNEQDKVRFNMKLGGERG